MEQLVIQPTNLKHLLGADIVLSKLLVFTELRLFLWENRTGRDGQMDPSYGEQGIREGEGRICVG